MSKNLVIVESPAKGKTIKKYLGPDYEVLASYGHVRDLVPKEGAVDTDGDFAMKYQVIERNAKHVDAIAKALKKSDSLLLATDPDREGEAISWHLTELLKERKALDSKAVKRVVFYEITKSAVQEAVEHPRELSLDLINAQQARRALDYLVGFNLSPLLWKKIRRGLSAGRVQSPALRLIVEREEEIERFEAREYWTIEATAEKTGQAFVSKLTQLHDQKLVQFSITNEGQAQAAKHALEAAARGELRVVDVVKKQRRRNPAPPFTTSTLQQEAARKLGFTASRTMRIAQQLYEGVDTGQGAVGLITYMRTDSVTLSGEALRDLRAFITQKFGQDNLPPEARIFKTKSKNAQEAHEAIRPTAVTQLPEGLKSKLNPDQHKLYDLIWKRTVACQMIHATLDTVAVDLGCGEGNLFRATGSTIRHAGFVVLYQEDTDDARKRDDEERALPPLEPGDRVTLNEIRADQHFTEPPPRYSEASLIKTLEEYGIGRPSTYASIISTLKDREYAEVDARRFVPTDVGRVVNRFLSTHFAQYVDYDFTARLEDDLDAVSRGEQDWVPLMRAFWNPFLSQVQDKEINVTRDEAAQARELGTDPATGKPVAVRMGRYGPFVQIGTRDDEDKPRFAGLRPGQKMDTITLEEAFALFQLPRELGESEEGELVSANIGRFGPYVKYGSKFVSIKDDDPYTISLARALELVREKKIADANRVIQDFPEASVQVLNGRYGPYITDGRKNAKIPKGEEPAALTLERCQQLLAEAPERKPRGRTTAKKTATKKKAPATKKTAAKKKASAKKKSALKKKTAAKKKTVTKKAAATKTVAPVD
jgi:DNA topoisomerase-1